MKLWVSRCNSQVLFDRANDCFTCSVEKPDLHENAKTGTDCSNFVGQWIKTHKAVEALFDGKPWPTKTNDFVSMVDFGERVDFEMAFMEPAKIPTFYARKPNGLSLFVQFYVRRNKAGRYVCNVRLREDRGGAPAFLIMEH